MNFRKMLKIAEMPICILIVLNLLSYAISYMRPTIGPEILIDALFTILICLGFGVSAWVGYKAVKEGANLTTGAMTGALTGAISELATIAINLGLVSASGAAIIFSGAGIFAIVILVAGGTILGAVLGAIGAWVATRSLKRR